MKRSLWRFWGSLSVIVERFRLTRCWLDSLRPPLTGGCELCPASFLSPFGWPIHARTRKHRFAGIRLEREPKGGIRMRRFRTTYSTEGGGRWVATWWIVFGRFFRHRIRPA